jgi:hypothetical protein
MMQTALAPSLTRALVRFALSTALLVAAMLILASAQP